jgi:hypothetical protein
MTLQQNFPMGTIKSVSINNDSPDLILTEFIHSCLCDLVIQLQYIILALFYVVGCHSSGDG